MENLEFSNVKKNDKDIELIDLTDSVIHIDIDNSKEVKEIIDLSKGKGDKKEKSMQNEIYISKEENTLRKVPKGIGKKTKESGSVVKRNKFQIKNVKILLTEIDKKLADDKLNEQKREELLKEPITVKIKINEFGNFKVETIIPYRLFKKV